jgi:hypothetical protein
VQCSGCTLGPAKSGSFGIPAQQGALKPFALAIPKRTTLKSLRQSLWVCEARWLSYGLESDTNTATRIQFFKVPRFTGYPFFIFVTVTNNPSPAESRRCGERGDGGDC